MTTGEFGEIGQNPSEDALLAAAMADRQAIEDAHNQLITYEITGVMPEPVDVAFATAVTAAGALFLIKSAKYSGTPVKLDELIDELFSTETVRSLFVDEDVFIDEEEAVAARDSVRTLLGTIIGNTAAEFDINMDEKLAQFVSNYDAAVALAAENAVTPETVYIDDALYAELVRRTTDMSKFAHDVVATTAQLTETSLTNFMISTLEARIRAQYAVSHARGPLIEIVGYEAEMAEYYASEEYAAKCEQDIQNRLAYELEKFYATPQLDEILAKQVEQTKRVNIAKARDYIVRYWGEDALSTMSAEIQEALA